MPYLVPPSVALANRGFDVIDTGSTDHRGLVIRITCDLENDLARVVFAHFKRCNADVTWARAEKELFSESGLLSSLSKLTRIAVYLGLVSDEEAHDLRLLGRIRNMYAHGRLRDQFDRDEGVATEIRKLRLYQNSSEAFAGYELEWIYLGCTAQLSSLLRSRTANESASAT